MKLKRKFSIFLIIFLLLFSFGCSLTSLQVNELEQTNRVPTLTNKPTVASAKTIFSTQEPPSVSASPTKTKELINDVISFNRTKELWVSEVSSNLIGMNLQSVIGPPQAFECNDRYEAWYNDQRENNPTEYFLNLEYDYPVNPSEIVIYFASISTGNIRVELLDSSSGLGTEIYNGVIDTGGICPGVMHLPVDSDLIGDTLVLAFRNSDPTVYIDAVSLIGSKPNFLDIPVFWRIEIPFDHMADPESDFPGGLASDQFGNIFLANGNNGLFRYDIEGNLLQEYVVPDLANIRDVVIDNNGQIVITDLNYKWYVILDQEGIQVDAGGEDFGWNGPREIAIHPITGNLYILDETDEYSRIRVYSSETNRLIRDIPLETIGIQMHKGLAFDPQGYLYTADQLLGSILKIDPETGEEIDYLGYEFMNKVSPSDLAIDQNGMMYILLNASPDDSAVYILNPQGSLIHQLGELTYDGSNWQEGVFFFPVSISVTPDGKYLTICEVGYLATYWLELDDYE